MLTRWYGAEGRAFERVCRAFEVLGYQPPRPDEGAGIGAYGANIVAFYQGTLTRPQVQAVIEFALGRGLVDLRTLQPGDYAIVDGYVMPA